MPAPVASSAPSAGTTSGAASPPVMASSVAPTTAPAPTFHQRPELLVFSRCSEPCRSLLPPLRSSSALACRCAARHSSSEATSGALTASKLASRWQETRTSASSEPRCSAAATRSHSTRRRSTPSSSASCSVRTCLRSSSRVLAKASSCETGALVGSGGFVRLTASDCARCSAAPAGRGSAEDVVAVAVAVTAAVPDDAVRRSCRPASCPPPDACILSVVDKEDEDEDEDEFANSPAPPQVSEVNNRVGSSSSSLSSASSALSSSSSSSSDARKTTVGNSSSSGRGGGTHPSAQMNSTVVAPPPLMAVGGGSSSSGNNSNTSIRLSTKIVLKPHLGTEPSAAKPAKKKGTVLRLSVKDIRQAANEE
mmetsp:Transcript_7422/g.22846  ORF Transcript_7422/g.22846 Transcript_7422/m.22846 type:complete len:366 (+) Transcript_7422:598-1695(+)